MATCHYVLGIDSSTASTKAIVWDLDGHPVSTGRVGTRYEQPVPGWAEQQAEWWWESTSAAVRAALRPIDPADILSVGLTWQRETWVPVGRDGKPLRPAILWMDARGEEELAELRSDIGDRFCEMTGKPLDVTPSIFKVLWLRRHQPDVLARMAALLEVGGYLTRELTGQARTCTAGADTMGLLDMRTRAWSPELVRYAGLSLAQLPELVGPGELLGKISHAAAHATGLLEGTPLVAGGGDGQCSAIGAGALFPDIYGISLGTGLSMNVHVDQYRAHRAFRTLIGCVPNSSLAEVNSRACSLIVQWFVREFATSETGQSLSAEEALDRRIEDLPPGSDGLLTLPYWRGAMMPHNKPLVRGATVGWSDYHTQAHFYRSLLEGMAFEFRYALEAVEAALCQPCNAIHIAGGGSQSRAWCRIISDIARKPVKLSASAESTCLGAAMLAATAVGAFPSIFDAASAMTAIRETLHPIDVNARLYDRIYHGAYLRLLPALDVILADLRAITTSP